MKEYIITIASASVAAALADIIAPDGWRKYIRIIIGFLVISAILAPIAEFRHVRLLPVGESVEISEEPLYDSVAAELRRRVESDIEERVKEEFNTEVTAEAEIDADAEHHILGVRALRITCRKNPAGMAERLKTIYGCENIEIKFE